MKRFNKLTAWFLSLAMLMTLIPSFTLTVSAVDDTTYVASVTTAGGSTTNYYETLDDALEAVQDCTEADNATVKLLKSIDLGDQTQYIGSGVFTLDLNGNTFAAQWLEVDGGTVTITDSLGGGEIKGEDDGVYAEYCTLTIKNADITATGENSSGVYAYNAKVSIEGGTISGVACGVNGTHGDEVTIKGATITGYDGVITGSNTLSITNADITSTGEDGCGVGGRNVTITGGTITATGEDGYGVYVDRDTLSITNTDITASGNYGTGVQADGCTDVTIEGGTISCEDGSGVFVDDCSKSTIEGSTISGYYAGVQAVGGTLEITDAEIRSTHSEGWGVQADGCTEVTITGGTISANGYGVWGDNTAVTIEDSTISCEKVGVDADSSTLTITKCQHQRNRHRRAC